jgi:POT family proton-dependent oligopeptide transporter
MLFIPLFDQILYPRLEARGLNIQPLKRMEYGMFLGAIAFFASALLEYSIQQGPPNSISLAWQIPQITILTVAEILLNVTGLEVGLFWYRNNNQVPLCPFLCLACVHIR